MKILAIISLFVILLVGSVPSANAAIRPVKEPGVTVITDGMATRLNFRLYKSVNTVCVDVRTAPGKPRHLNFYSNGERLGGTLKVPANYNSPGIPERCFRVKSRYLYVKVEEQVLKPFRFLARGRASVKLW